MPFELFVSWLYTILDRATILLIRRCYFGELGPRFEFVHVKERFPDNSISPPIAVSFVFAGSLTPQNVMPAGTLHAAHHLKLISP
jgi:hypothetical protein